TGPDGRLPRGDRLSDAIHRGCRCRTAGACHGSERLRPVSAAAARPRGLSVRCIPSSIPDVLIIEPDVHRDGRGFFVETYHAAKYRASGIAAAFVQDNHTRSLARTIRGLHMQHRRPQAKLIRVIAGEIYDVAVDLRRG